MAEIEVPSGEELEELKGKKFTRKVALMTALYAVFLAITSLGGNNAAKEMLLVQQQASDQWSYYQAKDIRDHMDRGQKLKLEAELLERKGAMKPEVRERFETLLKDLEKEENRYQKEIKEIKARARELEKERDRYRSQDAYFDFGEVCLQIAIVLASVAILSTSLTLFLFSTLAATLGCLLSINGFLLLVRIPLLG
ncbi:MAG TPA: DUF4337 domain-containing protein [Thermodesulfobacteriota bacterium]|nr:DUF4337 domain-containing protein [Thermodesulfobacteriota bacterium]